MELFFGAEKAFVIDLIHAAIKFELEPVRIAEVKPGIATGAFAALENHRNIVLLEILAGLEQHIQILDLKRQMFKKEEDLNVRKKNILKTYYKQE